MHELGAPPLFPYAVYTTIGSSRFEGALGDDDGLKFTERKRWTSAEEMLNEARKWRQRVPLLISDGTRDTSRLLGWGLLDWVEPVPPKGSGGTLVRANKLRRLRGRRTQDLLLRSTGQPIAPVFIRPYALVHTPAFLPTGRAAPAPFSDAPAALTLFTFGGLWLGHRPARARRRRGREGTWISAPSVGRRSRFSLGAGDWLS